MEKTMNKSMTNYVYNIIVILWWLFVVVNYYNQYYKWY